MGVTTTTTCDNCGAEAPEDSNYMFPKGGWLGLNDGYHRGRTEDYGARDFCSMACIAAWATRKAEQRGEVVTVHRAEVDALEAVFAAPAAAKKPAAKRAPRKPRPTP